ncbi:MAG: hypothetical protein VX768_13885 [Planctomycetota bacterium]|nr:hypothetical protein [Planctomycetota bacterium]
MIRSNFWLALISGLVLLNGCGSPEARREKYIRGMIAGFEEQKKEVLEKTKGVFMDIQVYRDGEKDGVVFERQFAKGLEPVNEDLKAVLVESIRNDADSRLAIQMGIYVKFIDKSHGGKVLREVTASKDDL